MNSNLRNFRSGKKQLEAELNLTSFIDLLSTCVCFLLITAVWIQIGSMEIKQSHGTEGAESDKKSYDMEVVFKDENNIQLKLKQGNKSLKNLKVSGENTLSLVENFKSVLSQDLKQFLLAKNIEVSSTTITPHKKVFYEELVKTMSALRAENFMNIGILSQKFR